MKSMSELIEWFQLTYPELVRSMRQSNHNRQFIDNMYLEGFDPNTDKIDVEKYFLDCEINPYHQEGDVWTHTMMVCKQAENEPYMVKLAALLHDIGKPDARSINPKNGYVSFYNHDAISAFKSLKVTKDLGLSSKERAQIFNMLALHTQIFKQEPDQLKKLFAGQQDLADDFVRLGRADNNGRFTKVPSLTWTEFIDVNDKPNVDKEKEVVILCGLPGSGKSTYVRGWAHVNNQFYSVVSRDDCLMEIAKKDFGDDVTYNEAFKMVNQKSVDKALRQKFIDSREFGRQVFVDMTHMSKKSRKKSLSYFGPEYKRTCVVVLTDLEEIYLRNEKRDGKNIDRRVIKRMMKSFYPPMLDEFDEVKYIF